MNKTGLYETKMDQATALRATEHLSTVLLLDVPAGTQFGLDGQCFVVGEKFRGVKMIHPGVHFLSTNNTSQSCISAPVSFFCFFDRQSILVRQWNPETEQLEEFQDVDQEERLRQGVRRFEFDDGLAPWNASHWSQWKTLSGWITQQTRDRIMNGLTLISVAEEARGTEGLSRSVPSEAALIEQLEKNADQVQQGQKLNYKEFPALIKEQGCQASELSAMNLDKTGKLSAILRDCYGNDWKQLLGEMQFAFVVFFFGQSLQSLEQWKLMLHLLLGCFDGACTFPELFSHFLKALRHQLQFLLRNDNESLDEAAELLSNSFLKADLTEFIRCEMAEDSGLSDAVRKECTRLASLVLEKLQWNLEDVEDGEYAPTVVT